MLRPYESICKNGMFPLEYDENMSKTTWNILGILTILAGISLFMLIPDRFAVLPPDQRPKFIAGCVFILGVLGAIVGICFFPKSRPITLRILGGIGIAACVFNLIEGAQRGNFSQFPLTLGFWLPGSIYLVVKGQL
jgi:cyanate permease